MIFDFDKHHRQFPIWLNEQAAGKTWETHNPYACPLSAYFRPFYPQAKIAIWKDAFWLGSDTVLLQPNHRFRRLLVGIMNRKEVTVTREDVIELVKVIWRTEYSDGEKFNLVAFRAHRKEVAAKQRLEWGW